jgi:hypothetical protein
LYDAAVALGAHDWKNAAGEIMLRDQIDLYLAPQNVGGEIFHGADLTIGGIIEQRIETPARQRKRFARAVCDR